MRIYLRAKSTEGSQIVSAYSNAICMLSSPPKSELQIWKKEMKFKLGLIKGKSTILISIVHVFFIPHLISPTSI
jgi:hypothetical protein